MSRKSRRWKRRPRKNRILKPSNSGEKVRHVHSVIVLSVYTAREKGGQNDEELPDFLENAKAAAKSKAPNPHLPHLCQI